MILHCVFCAVAPGADLSGVIAELGAFARALPGVQGFEAGPNRDFERKTPAYPEGFVIRFEDAAALERYAVDPTHQALGAQLVAGCVGGAAGILVFDLEVP